MSLEGCKQVAYPRSVAILHGALSGPGHSDKFWSDMFVNQTSEQNRNTHEAVTLVLVDSAVFPLVNHYCDCGVELRGRRIVDVINDII